MEQKNIPAGKASEIFQEELKKNTEISSVSSEKIPLEKIREIGGPKGKEPTRYGDWEQKGRCTDF